MHRLLIVGREQVRRPAVLAVPRMEVLVRQEGCEIRKDVVVDERPLGAAVVGALMMFQPSLAEPVAQREQKVVSLVRTGTEQRGEFGRKALVGFQTIRADGQRGVAIGGDIDHMLQFRARRQIQLLQMLAGDDGLID